MMPRAALPWFVLVAVLSTTAFAADSHQLPANFLAGMHVLHANNAGGLHGKGNIPTPQGFPAGVDTIVNFTGHFTEQGVYFDGSSHHVWEYSMVGNPPEQGGTTTYNAPVVPVSLHLLDPDGNLFLVYDVTPFVTPFLNGPVFGNASYSSSPQPTQITDAIQRAEFGNHARADWHTLLTPSVKTSRVMTLPFGTYF